jgi:sterol desaturase/sphingolipid hydroxylase (fatty acid hydroxylase superfamily)
LLKRGVGIDSLLNLEGLSRMFEIIRSVLFSHAKWLFGFAPLFLVVEFLFPAHKEQSLIRKDSKLDIAYSFLLPLIYFPFSIFCTFHLSLYFYGAVGMPSGQTNHQIIVTILNQPAHGKAKVLDDGSVYYQPGQSYSGSDFFIIKKTDGENSLVQRIEAKADFDQTKRTVYSAKNPLQISPVVQESVWGGKISEGFTGWILSVRNLIQKQSLPIQIFLALLIVDFLGYWRHRIMHSKFLWPFHIIHHSSKQVDWLSANRFHPVNHYITSFFNLLILTALIADPFVSATAMLMRVSYGLFAHSNLRISYGYLNCVLVSPLFHRWHHSDSEAAFNRNYSAVFSFFDLIFGTFYLPEDKKDPNTFGFFGGELTQGLIQQTIYPFLKLAEMRGRT